LSRRVIFAPIRPTPTTPTRSSDCDIIEHLFKVFEVVLSLCVRLGFLSCWLLAIGVLMIKFLVVKGG
jgi:hypothetical protein